MKGNLVILRNEMTAKESPVKQKNSELKNQNLVQYVHYLIPDFFKKEDIYILLICFLPDFLLVYIFRLNLSKKFALDIYTSNKITS